MKTTPGIGFAHIGEEMLFLGGAGGGGLPRKGLVGTGFASRYRLQTRADF